MKTTTIRIKITCALMVLCLTFANFKVMGQKSPLTLKSNSTTPNCTETAAVVTPTLATAVSILDAISSIKNYTLQNPSLPYAFTIHKCDLYFALGISPTVTSTYNHARVYIGYDGTGYHLYFLPAVNASLDGTGLFGSDVVYRDTTDSTNTFYVANLNKPCPSLCHGSSGSILNINMSNINIDSSGVCTNAAYGIHRPVNTNNIKKK